MKGVSVVAFALSTATLPVSLTQGAVVERLCRTPRYERGDTNIRRLQPVDDAAWVWHPALTNEIAVAPERYLRFRRRFEAPGGELRFDVSADERYVLLLDGEVVSRGPGFGLEEHWVYRSYRTVLTPGEHMLEAVVWRLGRPGPYAQLSWRGGFVFKAEGAYDALLTTGKAEWEVGELSGTKTDASLPMEGAWGGGDPFAVRGSGVLAEQPRTWERAAVVRLSVRPDDKTRHMTGARREGWMLFPSELPDQTETTVRPGRFCRGGDGLSPDNASFAVNPGERRTLLWDLGDYYCAYPVLKVDGGKGSRITWGWAESMRDPKRGNRKARNRNDWEGMVFDGFTDAFFPDGRRGAEFSTPWWRCGRWCELTVEAGDEPVFVRDISLVETRYPLEDEGEFRCDDETLDPIRRICLRGMQMCDHELLFDCPFYEQQMYPGDTRTQLMTLTSLSADDRMIRNAIELFDFGRRDNGMVPMNFPSRGAQESATYSMCQALMYGDYVLWHGNAEWLRARLPGLRHTLFGLARYEGADGLLARLPGWSFIDWVDDSPHWHEGVSPDGQSEAPGAVNNLFWLLTLKGATRVERALGETSMARIWDEKAERVARAVRTRFWSAERGMVADNLQKTAWSEHAQCLAVLSDLLSPDDESRAFEALTTRTDLAPCSVYFSYYLFETYFRKGRGDLFLKRLDLWRDYVRRGLRTPVERPDDGSGKGESRSDCHAWGSHPLYFMQSGLAGVKPDAPFFGKVLVAPSPGPLKFIRSRVPHPKGMIEVDLRFHDRQVSGTIVLPEGVPGRFVWQGAEKILLPGENRLTCPDAL